jgi:hypothetical protein
LSAIGIGLKKRNMKFLEFIAAPGFDKFVRMLILMLCLLVLAGMGIFCLETGRNLDGCSMIVTAIISIALQIVGFDWGSSAGSKSKDEMIGKLLNKE